jgi:P-type Cu+ transporter
MPTRPEPEEYPEPEDLSLLVTDPVCGRDVAITRAASSSDYGGATYYFCSLQCQQDFERLPEHYIPPPANAVEP